MAYQDTKVYYDGSHYIAIPKRPAPGRPGVRVPEDLVEVVDEEQEEIQDEPTEEQEDESDEVEEKTEEALSEAPKKPTVKRRATRRELFNELYQRLLSEPKRSRRGKLIQGMRPYFKTEQEAIEYVDKHLERKQRNLIVRRMRFSRKVNLHDFNYFCTFTYDGSLHTEDTFRKRLAICFNRFCSRKGWKYAGVWERS
ncbi:MAG: hypothetical protein IKV00_10070, partial [Clostridia bacterium]|nr:hypothetical protein [Clostridia bacterium]